MSHHVFSLTPGSGAPLRLVRTFDSCLSKVDAKRHAQTLDRVVPSLYFWVVDDDDNVIAKYETLED